MRILPLIVAGAMALAPSVIAQPEAWSAAEQTRAAAKARAFESVASGDPVVAVIAVGQALLMSPDNAELRAALERLSPDAVPAAIAQAEALLAQDEPGQAVELLGAVRAATRDERLVEPLAEARARNLLHEASAHEAAGRAEAAKRMIILAANIRPNDPAVLAALARNGIEPPPPPRWAAAPGEQPADRPPEAPEQPIIIQSPPADFGRGDLERDFAFLDSKLDALTLQVARLERDTTLPSNRGNADSALTNLDRRVDDLQRSLERTIADLARQVSSLSRDVETMRRDLLRLR